MEGRNIVRFQIGDTVIVNKDKKRDLWKIEKFHLINPRIVRIKGLTNRSIIDVYEDQLIKVDERTIEEISERNKRNCVSFISGMRELLRNGNAVVEPSKSAESDKAAEPVKPKGEDKKNLVFSMPGTILHLDTYKPFMEKCLELYKQLQIPAVGYYMEPSELPNKIKAILEKEQPDIVVITGHDNLTDIKNPSLMESYLNSKYFIEAVREARRFDRNKNSLVIVAGACKSFFEALMDAGANFASSPMRVRVSDVDPAILAMIVALTPVLINIDILEAVSYTRAGTDGFGGIETEGALKKAIPNKGYVPPTDDQPSKKDETVGTPIYTTRGYFNLYPCNYCPYNIKGF